MTVLRAAALFAICFGLVLLIGFLRVDCELRALEEDLVRIRTTHMADISERLAKMNARATEMLKDLQEIEAALAAREVGE